MQNQNNQKPRKTSCAIQCRWTCLLTPTHMLITGVLMEARGLLFRGGSYGNKPMLGCACISGRASISGDCISGFTMCPTLYVRQNSKRVFWLHTGDQAFSSGSCWNGVIPGVAKVYQAEASLCSIKQANQQTCCYIICRRHRICEAHQRITCCRICKRLLPFKLLVGAGKVMTRFLVSKFSRPKTSLAGRTDLGRQIGSRKPEESQKYFHPWPHWNYRHPYLRNNASEVVQENQPRWKVVQSAFAFSVTFIWCHRCLCSDHSMF